MVLSLNCCFSFFEVVKKAEIYNDCIGWTNRKSKDVFDFMV